MSEEHYSKFSSEERQEMILRDYLAVDRTIMSNESSFLSYMRTSLTMLIAAITFLKLFNGGFIHTLGWVLIVGAGLLLVHGATRYESTQRILHGLTGEMKNNPDAKHANLAQRFLIASQSLLSMFR